MPIWSNMALISEAQSIITMVRDEAHLKPGCTNSKAAPRVNGPNCKDYPGGEATIANNSIRRLPYETKLIETLFAEGALPNIASIEVEPRFGRAVRIEYQNGATRMMHDGDLGLNSWSANKVARDKLASKHFLRSGGFCTPDGEGFPLPRRNGSTSEQLDRAELLDQIIDYIRTTFAYPVYIKPHDEAYGIDIWKCYDDQQVLKILRGYINKERNLALVEAAISAPDYRVVVLDGKVISAYRRDPARIAGDGILSIAELICKFEADSPKVNEDAAPIAGYIPQMEHRLANVGLTSSSIPLAGEIVQLLDISNICAGGTATDLTACVSPRWVELATKITTHFGLRFCGVDIACADLSSEVGEYSILEVNGSPGLDLYGSVGEPHDGIVHDLYARVFNLMPAG